MDMFVGFSLGYILVMVTVLVWRRNRNPQNGGSNPRLPKCNSCGMRHMPCYSNARERANDPGFRQRGRKYLPGYKRKLKVRTKR